MEILFECCIAYIWYFYYRSMIERKLTETDQNSQTTTLPSVAKINENNEIKALLQQLQLQINELKMQQKDGIRDLRPPENNHLHVNDTVQDSGTVNRTTRPIGFLTENPPLSYNAFQDVVTDEKIFLEDKYTITHKERRTGKIKRYTLDRVNNFISHYRNAVQEAVKKGMEQEVLQNRKNWLNYWLGRRGELLDKLKQPV